MIEDKLQQLQDLINSTQDKKKTIKRLRAAVIQLQADEIDFNQSHNDFNLETDLSDENLLLLKELYIKLITKAFNAKDYSFIYRLNKSLMTATQKANVKSIVIDGINAKLTAKEIELETELNNIVNPEV